MISADDMKTVAAGFLTAARSVRGAGLWGDSKVFLAALYDALGAAQVMTFAEFGGVLVELHRAGLITLSRADLIGAMPRTMVIRSEIVSLGSSFHFIRID